MGAALTIRAAGREVRLSNPDKVVVPEIGVTKRELCEYHPWPVRRADLDRPDELRVDLDPVIHPRRGFRQVRRAALALAREVERRAPDPSAGIDAAAGDLGALLELADRDEREGLGDAPWPPHFAKGATEPTRAPPSRRRSGAR